MTNSDTREIDCLIEWPGMRDPFENDCEMGEIAGHLRPGNSGRE